MKAILKTVIAVAFAAMAFTTTETHAGSSNGFFDWLSTPVVPTSRSQGQGSDTRSNTTSSGSGTRYDYRTYRTSTGDIDWNQYALTRMSEDEALDTGTSRREVDFHGDYTPGSIVINTSERRLYFVLPGGRAYQYHVGVGRPGFEWYGEHNVSRKAEWPDWRPPEEMRQRQPELPTFMPGGPGNPMGARALYLGSTIYRIHGTTEAQTIGYAVSSGCIRMLNQDVIDLYGMVDVGARVYVRA